MACLLSFCFSHIPTHAIIANRVLLHKTFFSKLKSTCLSLYPCYGQRWDLIFKKLLNNYRQRQYTKCHSLKVKRLPQVSVSNNNRKLKPVVTELVANQEQLLKDVENELKKKKPSLPTLSILNRQLFDNETFSMIPKRISFAPTLMLEEAIRFYANFKDAIIKIQAILY
nr:uncharacterized protein LOC124817707 [Hydra vulgaris]